MNLLDEITTYCTVYIENLVWFGFLVTGELFKDPLGQSVRDMLGLVVGKANKVIV